MRRPEDDYVPSHQQIRRRLSQEEKAVWQKIVVLVVALVVLAGLLGAYWLQHYLGNRSLSSLKEDAKKEVFEQLHQDKQSAQEQLQFVSYHKLVNNSNLTQYLLQQVALHIQDVDQQYIDEFEVHRIKQRFQKNLTATHHLLKKYLQHEAALKAHYNDGLQMTEDLYRTYFDYENCRKNIRLEKDNLLASTLDLQRKRMEEMRDDAELSDKQKEQSYNQQDQQKLLETTREQVAFYKEEIASLDANQQDNRNIQAVLKQKLRENEEYDMALLELQQNEHQQEQHMKRIRERLEEYYKDNTRLQAYVTDYEKQIDFLQLQIKDKTLDSSISKILREMGVSQTLNKQLELAKVVKQKLVFEVKMAVMKGPRMTPEEKIQEEADLKDSQAKYKELMVIVNQLKRKAFLHKMESIAPFIAERQRRIQELMAEMNKYKVKIHQNSEIIEILLKELQKIQQSSKAAGENKVRIQLQKGLNTEFIDKHQGAGGSRENDRDILRARLVEAEDRIMQIEREIEQNMHNVKEEKSSYRQKKRSDSTLISRTQDQIIDYLNALNIKIAHCKGTETRLQELVVRSDEQSERIRQQVARLREVQKDIQRAVRDM